MNFVVYHCGFETAITEGPYTEATRNRGVNRLISSLRDAGVGPGSNVYGELGSIWWFLMRTPTEAAHVLQMLVTWARQDLWAPTRSSTELPGSDPGDAGLPDHAGIRISTGIQLWTGYGSGRSSGSTRQPSTASSPGSEGSVSPRLR
jgi:hypothetical protein